MYTNVNLAAPLGVLAFLGAAFLLLSTGVVFIYSLLSRKTYLARLTTIFAAILIGSYAVATLLFSLASSNQVLARGEEKHFCEIDCHLAYSILDVRQTRTLGNEEAKAAGVFYIIKIKTRFDENTIGRNRGNGLLYPNSRSLSVSDSAGQTYPVSQRGQEVLERAGNAGTPISTPLRPGESYTSVFVFDLPADVSSPTLLINESDWATRFIIGHENSLAHRKTSFQL